jgi:flagellar assembly protein FliH
MAKMEKFLFDTEFEVGGEDWDKEEVEEVEEAPDPNTLPHYSEDEMQAALLQVREESRHEGHATGLAEAREEAATFASQELVKICKQIERLAAAEANNIDMAQHEATGLALSVGRRLANVLIERHPLEFAEEMITETLNHMTEALRESKITIRVAPNLAEPLTSHIGTITEKTGFTGQTIILEEQDFGAGDCRVEWANGGAERLMTDIDRWIEDAVGRYLATIEEHEAPEATVEDEIAETNEATPEATEDDGVKAVGGSKAVRYDDEEKPEKVDVTQPHATAGAEPRADDEIKTVGGSKSVRYD